MIEVLKGRYTHSITKFFKREIFDGRGPSSPLACISLHRFYIGKSVELETI